MCAETLIEHASGYSVGPPGFRVPTDTLTNNPKSNSARCRLHPDNIRIISNHPRVRAIRRLQRPKSTPTTSSHPVPRSAPAVYCLGGLASTFFEIKVLAVDDDGEKLHARARFKSGGQGGGEPSGPSASSSSSLSLLLLSLLLLLSSLRWRGSLARFEDTYSWVRLPRVWSKD